MRETLLKYHNDMSGFSTEIPIVVTYDESTHELTYRQLNKLQLIPYLRPYYLPRRNFKLGILSPSGYVILMKGLQKLFQDSDLDKEGGSVSFSIGKLCLKIYKTYNNIYLVGPQEYIDLNFVNITNPILVWLIMKFYSIETRVLYKFLKNEQKFKKANKVMPVEIKKGLENLNQKV